MTTKLNAEMLNRATLFTLTISAWGNRKQADAKVVNTTAEKSSLNLTKRLVDSREYKRIVTHLNTTKAWCLARSMPSFFKDGVFLVKNTEIDSFESYLAAATEMLRGFVQDFLDEYPTQTQKHKIMLGDLWNEADYPTAADLKRRFGIDWNWIGFDVPENLPKKIREREEKKLQKKFAEAQEEILAALRYSFAQMVEHAIDRLKVKPGEKPPIFKDSMFENFDEFFETFSARNFMNDTELAELVEKSKTILKNVNPAEIRGQAFTRNDVAEQFTAVKKQIDELVKARPSRKFNLEED